MASNTTPAPEERPITTGRMASTPGLSGVLEASGGNEASGSSVMGASAPEASSAGELPSRPLITSQAKDMIPAMSGQERAFAPDTLVAFGRDEGQQAIGDGVCGVAYRAAMGPVADMADAPGTTGLSPIYVVKNNSEPVSAEAECLRIAGEFAFSPSNNPNQLVMKDKGTDLYNLLRSGRISVSGGRAYAKPLPAGQRHNIGLQLVHCVKNLHQCDLIHLDIKPENIAINSNGMVSLIDFGTNGTDLSGKTCHSKGLPKRNRL